MVLQLDIGKITNAISKYYYLRLNFLKVYILSSNAHFCVIGVLSQDGGTHQQEDNMFTIIVSQPNRGI